MKIKVYVNDFKKCVANVVKGAGCKPLIPSSNYIEFEFGEQYLTLHALNAMDLHIYANMEISQNVDMIKTKALVEAVGIGRIASKLPNEVEIEIELDNNILILQTSKCSYKLPVLMEGGERAELPDPATALNGECAEYTLDTEDFVELDKHLKAYFNVKEAGFDKYFFESGFAYVIDRTKAIRYKMPEEWDNVHLCLDQSTVNLFKVFKGAELKFRQFDDKLEVTDSDLDTTVIAYIQSPKSHEGLLQNIINAVNQPGYVKCDKAELLEALERLSAYMESYTNLLKINIEINPQSIRLSHVNNSTNEVIAEEDISAIEGAGEYQIYMNCNFMLDAIKVYSQDEVIFNFDTSAETGTILGIKDSYCSLGIESILLGMN